MKNKKRGLTIGRALACGAVGLADGSFSCIDVVHNNTIFNRSSAVYDTATAVFDPKVGLQVKTRLWRGLRPRSAASQKAAPLPKGTFVREALSPTPCVLRIYALRWTLYSGRFGGALSGACMASPWQAQKSRLGLHAGRGPR